MILTHGEVYQAVRDLAAELARLDCVIVSGGPGLMKAANEGVHVANPAAQGSIGIRVDLPFEQEVNTFVTEAFEHGQRHSRLRLLLHSPGDDRREDLPL